MALLPVGVTIFISTLYWLRCFSRQKRISKNMLMQCIIVHGKVIQPGLHVPSEMFFYTSKFKILTMNSGVLDQMKQNSFLNMIQLFYMKL